MGSIDRARLERRARRGYELGRARRALVGVLPLLPIVLLATQLSERLVSTLVFGAATFVLAGVLLWYGRAPQKAVLPGVMWGLVPLGFALAANQVHVCGPNGCSSLCLPACALGGLIAGIAVARVGARRKLGTWFWLSASAVALTTGAMGCACIGYTGVVGLVLGFAAGALPLLLRASWRGSER